MAEYRVKSFAELHDAPGHHRRLGISAIHGGQCGGARMESLF
jgi:hypothetical protein